MSARRTKRHWTSRLVALGACSDAVERARSYPSLAAAWRACERADWMLWLAGRVCPPPAEEPTPERARLVLAACACAATALRYVPKGERRPAEALRLARAWAHGRGGVTLEQVRAAAADAAADAASAAAEAATYAATYAATAAAYAAYAASASAYAYAASHAAAAAAAAAAASARPAALARMARIVRRYYPRPPRLRADDPGDRAVRIRRAQIQAAALDAMRDRGLRS